jgi:hypothetical protein
MFMPLSVHPANTQVVAVYRVEDFLGAFFVPSACLGDALDFEFQ